MYSDLECDYINPIDLCNRLNMYIVPEAGVHAFLTLLFLINGYWLPLILNLPLVAWNGKKYVPTSSPTASVLPLPPESTTKWAGSHDRYIRALQH